jgi:hypothetical protein
VDVLAGPDESWEAPGGGPGEVLAGGVLVLAVPSAGDSGDSGGLGPGVGGGSGGVGGAGGDAGGGVLLVAVRPATAERLAGAAGRRVLSVALRHASSPELTER